MRLVALRQRADDELVLGAVPSAPVHLAYRRRRQFRCLSKGGEYAAGVRKMAMYVYSTDGEPVGFLYETFIHDMEGRPLGRIIGSRVHRFDGSYVGEWFKEMVVDRGGATPRALPPMAVPQTRISPGRSWRRRAVVDYGYPDLFHRLCDDVAEGGQGSGARAAAA